MPDKKPTRDGLNEKIALEADKVFASATEDDLTSLHSEVEIKTQLRDAFIDTSMTDEMVQALYTKADVLNDAYLFFKEESRDNQVYLAVWDYLEKAEHDYLAEQMYERVKLEYGAYVDEVKTWPPQKIIDEAYTLHMLKEITESFDPPCSDLNTEQLRALYSIPDPMWILYHEWQHRDDTHRQDIEDTISDYADERAAEIENSKYEIDPDPFGLNEEAEDGQEP